jgi:tripartite-type tricarboxylate transporter receptor subunit TctC
METFMMQFLRRLLVLCIPLASALTCTSASWAQTSVGTDVAYPSRPLKIVVPFAPGGLTDVIARAVAARLGTELGQQVIVDNRAGAGGNIGAESVARAVPDGYTLLLTTQILALNKSAYRQISYDLEKDLVPVGEIGSSVNAIVARADLPATNLAELIAMMKKRPNSVNFAVPGASPVAPYFAMATKTQFTTVPYKGNAQAITDMLGGRVDVMNVALDTAYAHVQAGHLKILAIVTSLERSRLFPDIPVAAETIPGFAALGFAGLSAPKGTPQEIIKVLNAALQKVLENPELRRQFEKSFVEVIGGSPDSFGKRVALEVARWEPVVRATNAYVN